MSFYIKKKENFKVFKFFTVHIHNPQQQHLFPYFFFLLMKLNNLRYELRRKVSAQKETVDVAGERDGLPDRRNGPKGTDSLRTARTVDRKTKDCGTFI